MTRLGLEKAVVLAGGRGTVVCPLANLYPKLTFPVGPAPILAHVLTFLHEQGISDVAVVSSEHINWTRELVRSKTRFPDGALRVTWHFDDGTKGTAGSLKPLEGFVEDSDFLVVQSNLYIQSLDLAPIIAAHRSRGSGLTVVVEERTPDRTDLEHIEIGEDGRVARFEVPHYTQVNQRPLAFTGLYVFQPKALSTFDGDGYVDIKEQLLPLLHRASIPVHAYKTDGAVKRINTLEDYFRIHGEYLRNGVGRSSPFFAPRREILPGIWAAERAKISKNAYLAGPVVLGDGCVIEDGAQVIGPTTIGDRVCIEPGAHVRESILWEGSRIRSHARVEYSLVADGCVVPRGETVQNTVIIADERTRGSYDFAAAVAAQPIVKSAKDRIVRPAWFHPRQSTFSRFSKRCVDLLVSVPALLILSPLLLLISLTVKATSRGPILFSQRRCGKDGRPFFMHKFRTMIVGADRMKAALDPEKNVEGPMFKMKVDPRITPIGRLLRRTSLDELPQLFNVLKGEMSLVGPRPLAIEEMKFSPSWRDIRLSVKPGITGLWQVKARGTGRFHDWIEYDIFYAQHRSFLLDVDILWRTLWVAFRGSGAR